MLQFFIGLSILLLVIALIYWSERLIFGKPPKNATDFTFSAAMANEVVGLFAIVLIGIVLIPILCAVFARFAWRFAVRPLVRQFKRSPSHIR